MGRLAEKREGIGGLFDGRGNLLDHAWRHFGRTDADEAIDGDDETALSMTLCALEGALHAFEGSASDAHTCAGLEVVVNGLYVIVLRLVEPDEGMHLFGGDNGGDAAAVGRGLAVVLQAWLASLEVLELLLWCKDEDEAGDGRSCEELLAAAYHLGLHRHGYKATETLGLEAGLHHHFATIGGTHGKPTGGLLGGVVVSVLVHNVPQGVAGGAMR